MSSTFGSIRNKQFLSKPETLFFHNLGDIPEYDDIYPVKTKIKGVWDFCTSDSQNRYNELLQTKPSDWYYRNNQVKYTLNSEGYRTKEFDEIDWENSVVMFGCSHILGTGNDDSYTIPALLQNILGIPVINMGVNAGSIKTMAHNCLSLYNSYKTPKMIIFGWTCISRKGVYSIHSLESTTGFNTNIKFEMPEGIEDTIITNFLLVNMMRSLWISKCPIYEFSFFKHTSKLLKCDYYKEIDLARDDIHYGIKSHNYITKKIYNKIKNLL